MTSLKEIVYKNKQTDKRSEQNLEPQEVPTAENQNYCRFHDKMTPGTYQRFHLKKKKKLASKCSVISGRENIERPLGKCSRLW